MRSAVAHGDITSNEFNAVWRRIRVSTKENKNIYQIKREELGLTREKASEIIGSVTPERIEKIENERSNLHPDEVRAMAEGYKAPHLCNYYCANECPIGQQYVPATGDTDESYEKGDFKYNSAGEIIGLTDEGNEKETITIPKGKNVISTLLTRKSKAKELNFEGSVDPDYDMSYMSDPHSNLEKVVYPEGIETVSREFAYCSKLKEVVLPGSVKEVEGFAFSDAESLEKINLEDTQIEIMKKGTFLDCEKMTEIHLPDTVKKILEYAIPRNVVDIYIADNTEGGCKYAFYSLDHGIGRWRQNYWTGKSCGRGTRGNQPFNGTVQ